MGLGLAQKDRELKLGLGLGRAKSRDERRKVDHRKSTNRIRFLLVSCDLDTLCSLCSAQLPNLSTIYLLHLLHFSLKLPWHSLSWVRSLFGPLVNFFQSLCAWNHGTFILKNQYYNFFFLDSSTYSKLVHDV